MEKLKEKNTNLIVVEDKKRLDKIRKEHKVIKLITNIILKLLKLILKLTILVAIYGMIFSIVIYHSNKFMINKLREAEANKKVDPVLEVLRKEKDNKDDEKKNQEDNEEKDEK